jgi:hypothetical protein
MIRRYALFGTPVAALTGILIASLRQSVRLRQMIRAHLFPQVGRNDAAHLSVGAATLLGAFNLSWLVAQLSASGVVSPKSLGWMLYVLIPARWVVPLVVSIYLACTRAPALHITVLFLTTYIGAHTYLWDQVPLALLIRFWAPGLLLAIFCIGLRWLHVARLASVLAIAALTGYSITAVPWFHVYIDQVLML